MRRFTFGMLIVAVALLVPRATVRAQDAAAKPLQIYVIDPEGGKSALWIAPSGQTVLVDTGNPGARDLDRIMEVITAAGVTRIDYLISTHYHVDHIGGLQELVKRIPVGTFVDHGPTVEGPVDPAQREQVPGFQIAYATLYGAAKHLVVKPGDTIPVAGLDWRTVTSAGAGLKSPIAGALGAGRPNAACAQTQPKEITTDPENGQSIGSVVTMGRFRAADFADLLWNNEIALMCPNNPLGTVDLFMVTNHGSATSNSPALLHGLRPRAVVMQNGTNKGAAVDVMKTLRSSPGLEDIWQLHWSYTAGIEHNAPGVFIANLEEPATMAQRLTAPPAAGRGGGGGGGGAPPHVPAHWIKVTANANGSFTVTNSRNNFSKTYSSR